VPLPMALLAVAALALVNFARVRLADVPGG
jgi:hypothetical protein